MVDLVEAVGAWFVVSPVLGLAVGMVIARAGRVADLHELPGEAADRALLDDVVAAVARSAPERVTTTTVAVEAIIPAPAPAADDVLHLRLAHPEG